MRKVFITLVLALSLLPVRGTVIPKASDFNVVCDTLTERCNRRFLVRSKVSLEKLFLNNGALDLYFNRSLADYPWHEEDVPWFLSELNTEASEILGGFTVGSCMASGSRLEDLITPVLSRDGKYHKYNRAIKPKADRPMAAPL